MPTKAAEDLDAFLNNYQNYINACNYANQWIAQINGLVPILQADANHGTALTVDEQTAIATNFAAAQSAKIATVQTLPNPNASATNPVI